MFFYEGSMYKHIKGSDLNFDGISMGFASIGRVAVNCPTGDSVMRGSYERPDAHIPLINGKTLHATLGGSNGIKLTLFDGTKHTGTGGIEIGWVTARAMKKAVDIDHGLLRVNGKHLAFAHTPRPLKRMLVVVPA